MKGRAVSIGLLCAVIVVSVSSVVRGDLLVNEVLSNEPGASITLEWFELFNDGATSQNLSFFQIQVGANPLILDTTAGPIVIKAKEYLVICRNLFTVGNSPGFESVWGNNSGVWGDDPIVESYNVIEAGFSLPNSSGTVSVNGFNQSQISWSRAGGDGVSWERFSPLIDSTVQSIDGNGSTPGRVNSLTPVPLDLALDTVSFKVDMGTTVLSFSLSNRGINNVSGAVIDLFYGRDNSDPPESLAVSISVPPTDSGFTTVVAENIVLGQMYRTFTAVLSGDDRKSNNRLSFVAPGDGFPPVLLTEFLANPSGIYTSEWIEIVNRQDTVIDVKDWRFGDALSTALISPVSLMITPKAYLIITRDSTAFFASYPGFNGNLIEPASWPTLNNAGDEVRLFDSFGILADAFTYVATHADNVTWSREEGDTLSAVWGRSTKSGGSPGENNRVRIVQNANALSITVSPRIITPDGNGIDEEASIVITAPAAISFSVKLYDRQGRVVRTLEEQAPDLASEYRWDGRDDDGRRLPIGIYILFVEAAGVESRKQTIVIGR